MAALAAIVAIGTAARSLIRRRERGPALLSRPDPDPDLGPVPQPGLGAAPAASGSPPPIRPAEAQLTLSFRPIRAGLNLLSATVEGEVTVTNIGDAPAERVRVEARLLSAHAGQDAEIASILATSPARPATAPFPLAPGEERRIGVVMALPHEAIRPFAAAGRQMFVPLVTVGAHFRSGDRARRAGRAFAVGIERVDSVKLGPFRLDAGPRMQADVAVRPHGEPVEG